MWEISGESLNFLSNYRSWRNLDLEICDLYNDANIQLYITFAFYSLPLCFTYTSLTLQTLSNSFVPCPLENGDPHGCGSKHVDDGLRICSRLWHGVRVRKRARQDLSSCANESPEGGTEAGKD